FSHFSIITSFLPLHSCHFFASYSKFFSILSFQSSSSSQVMRRISVIYVLVALSTASYDNPSDSSPDGVQAFNPSHAPDPSCRTNEEYIQCATHCEPSCSNPNPVCIRSCAPAQCQCGYGYVRNEYGECVDTSGCPAQKEEATPSSTEIPMEETTTFSPPSAPQYVNPPSPPPFDDEPSTTTTQQYDSVPTEATASIDDETPAPKTESESPSEQTASPSSDYSSGGNGEKEDTVPSQDDDDVILVVSRLHPILLSPLSLSTSTGGPCGENTCRVGFKCDDSTAVGARCIPFDTRARSSCSSIRCRPGWSCVIAMDGPRCYRNEVLGLANANESTSGPLPVSDYSADSPSLPPLAEDGKKCSDIICPLGFSCFEDSSSPHPFCRSITEGRESPAPLCSDIQCAPNESCTDNHNGPVCTKNAPATCASTSCLTGSSCVDHPEGARCEGGPVVFAGKTCADSVCPDLHQCFDSLEGASCYPIPTDPVESISVPLKCDQMTCNEGEKCRDDEN
ncbi:hypothetical protein PMAYCL1PPCAC_29131, partial [Pristionchus mayeri]